MTGRFGLAAFLSRKKEECVCVCALLSIRFIQLNVFRQLMQTHNVLPGCCKPESEHMCTWLDEQGTLLLSVYWFVSVRGYGGGDLSGAQKSSSYIHTQNTHTETSTWCAMSLKAKKKASYLYLQRAISFRLYRLCEFKFRTRTTKTCCAFSTLTHILSLSHTHTLTHSLIQAQSYLALNRFNVGGAGITFFLFMLHNRIIFPTSFFVRLCI